jgi:hypothetical protein
VTVPGCLIALIAAQLGIFVILELAEWRSASSNNPLAALQTAYPDADCAGSEFRLLENDRGGMFLQDYRYVYEFTVTEQCQSSLWLAVRKRGFVQEEGGAVLRRSDLGYRESFVLDAKSEKVTWERDRT